MFESTVSTLGDFLNLCGDVLLKVLPKSPFVYIEMIPAIENILGYANYFVPISACLVLAEMWLVAIGTYYVHSIVLRWIKAVS